MAAIVNAIGLAMLRAPTPTRTSTRRISSVAYATDERGSDESTASPVTRERRSWCARWDGIGLPTTNRLTWERSPSSDDIAPFQGPTGLAGGLEVGSPLPGGIPGFAPEAYAPLRVPHTVPGWERFRPFRQRH